MNSPKVIARIAGSFYLAMFVFSLLGGGVRSRVIESGDASATAGNIRDSAELFRAGFASDLVEITCMLLAGMALYLLLNHVHRLAAAAMVTFVAVAVAIGCLNLLNQHAAVMIATGPDYTSTFGQAGSDALTMLFADMRQNGYYISAVFWGLWLLPLGYLVVRSGYVPKVLGVLLITGGTGYLVDVLVRFLAPDRGASIGTYLLAPGGIAELAFTAWLLIRAVKVAPAAADRDLLAAQHRR
jgi:hypothetical protein